MLPVTRYTLRVEFTTDLLGTQPQRDIFDEHMRKKAKVVPIPEGLLIANSPNGGFMDNSDAQLQSDAEMLAETQMRNTTAFHKFQGQPILRAYQLKAFFKSAAETLKELRNVKALKSKVTRYVFIDPGTLFLNYQGKIEMLERPLRAMTAQGERTSIANSEKLPAGTWFQCEVVTLDAGPISEGILRDLLDYGQYMGIGQWRNADYGRFTYTLTKKAA